MIEKNNTVLVTSCDTKYFPLLKGLIRSIFEYSLKYEIFKDKYIIPNVRFDFAIIDSGLDEYEKQWIYDYFNNFHDIYKIYNFNYKIIEIENHKVNEIYKFDIPFEYKKIAYMERPFLNLYLPEYKNIIWIDSDTWVQNTDGLYWFKTVSENNSLGIVPEIDRNNIFNFKHLKITKGFAYSRYKIFFGEEIANQLIPNDYPVFNNGVFSCNINNKMWNYWQTAFAYAVDRVKNNEDSDLHFGIDQATLNYVIWKNNIKVIPLPIYYNWMCTHNLPILHNPTRLLFEPIPPYNKISIIHLLDYTKWGRVPLRKYINVNNISEPQPIPLDFFEITKTDGSVKNKNLDIKNI